ncbi:hypothetical protein BD414DRAFT_481851 [Trametes punicea]|nr:hypothetical protein BD414DRAFT_481851 [Trametes punicea]
MCTANNMTHVVPGASEVMARHSRYRLLFFMLLRAFFSAALLPSPCPPSSAFRFVPAIAAVAFVFTDTRVDLPCAPPVAILAICASAALQSAAESLIAYLHTGRAIRQSPSSSSKTTFGEASAAAKSCALATRRL